MPLVKAGLLRGPLTPREGCVAGARLEAESALYPKDGDQRYVACTDTGSRLADRDARPDEGVPACMHE